MLTLPPILEGFTETVGNWQFRDDLTDLSSFSNDLTHNAGSISYTTGITESGNTSILLDGTANSIVITPPGESDFEMGTSTDFTLEIVFKTTQTSYTALIEHSKIGAYPSGYIFGMSSGQLFLFLGDASPGDWPIKCIDTSGNTYNDGNWHYFAATINRTTNTINMYIDGIIIVDSPWDITGLGSLSSVQADFFWIGDQHDGLIDQVMATKKILTSGEIWIRSGLAATTFIYNNSADETSNTPDASLDSFDIQLKHVCDHALAAGQYTLSTCARCAGTGVYYDIKFGTTGRPDFLQLEDKLLQSLEKIVLTDTNNFHTNLSTGIVSRIGTVTEDIENLIKYDLIQAVATLQENQRGVTNLSSRATISKLDKVEVIRENETSLRYLVTIITVSGDTLELSGTINVLS